MTKTKCLVCYSHVTNVAVFVARLTDAQIVDLINHHGSFISIIKLDDLTEARALYKSPLDFTAIPNFEKKHDKALIKETNNKHNQ